MRPCRLYSFFTALILPVFLAAQQYELHVRISGEQQKGKAVLRYWGDNGPHFDSASFTKGEFIIKGLMPPGPKIARLSITNENESAAADPNSCDIWLEAATINVTADKNLFNARYSGSQAQQQFSELQQNMQPVTRKYFQLDKIYEKAEAEKDVMLKDKLVNNDYPAVFREKQAILGDFIRRHPGSMISAYKFEDFAGESPIDLAVVEPVYALLHDSIRQHARVKKVEQLITITRRTAPGMMAIEFSQTDTSGNPITLSSFRGKYVLIDFWAGWCVPCRAENPHLIRVYERYKNKGLEILGVSLDGERKRWTNAIITDKLTWPQVSDLQIFENTVAKLYGITSIPQNILVGPDAKIIERNLRGSALDEKLKELFK